MKGYTDFMSGFFGFASKPDHLDGTRYLDWDKVEQICKENPDARIEAGLREDWNNTSGLIFKNGKYYNGYVYGCSRWATPIVDVDGEEIECWNHEEKSPGKPDWWGRGQKLLNEWDDDGD